MKTTERLAVMSYSHALPAGKLGTAGPKASWRITPEIPMVCCGPGAVAAVSWPKGRTANTTAMVRT